MADNGSEAAQREFLSPNVVVALTETGLSVQVPLYAPPMPLDPDELRLIAGISDATHETVGKTLAELVADGVDPGKLRGLARRLRIRGSVVTESTERVDPERAGITPGHVPDSEFSIFTPLFFEPVGGRFRLLDHDGREVAHLGTSELVLLAELRSPSTIHDALARLVEAGHPAPTLDEVKDLIACLDGAGLLVERRTENSERASADVSVDADAVKQERFAAQARRQDEAEAQREQRTGVRRTKVIPVSFDQTAPLALGLIVAYAKAFEDGRLEETFDFRRDWVWVEDSFAGFTERPAIYLFSNYLWSHEKCIEVSRRVKEANPASITIHGGPDTPRYEGDARAHMALYPHIDIAVRGEGERTTSEVLAALCDQIGGDAQPDLSVLADVAGLYYRDGDSIVMTADRERITDLDTIPSPFLTGLFEAYEEIPGLHVTLETNRGCPYGCTFCDWGAATMSRIRKFDSDRVLAELDWSAKSFAASLSMADANFGIFPRDVEFAEHVANLRQTVGYPRSFGVAYAKNTVKHLQSIIKPLAEAGIVTQGLLSLQSMHDGTLDAIRRSNIKTEKYDALAAEMRAAELPLTIELMLGLPGSTCESFRDDLQQCIDRELQARVNLTTLLVNSPMNDPEYREEYRIVTSDALGPGKLPLVVETSTFSREEHHEMVQVDTFFQMVENFGMLRQLGRFVRQETGNIEMDFYDRLLKTAIAEPDRWPALHMFVTLGPSMMGPPTSWRKLIDEARSYVVDELGVADDSALATVLRVQHALLPSPGRTFPLVLELDHDLGAWHQAMLDRKAQDERDRWHLDIPHLREYGPATFPIDDPFGIVTGSLGAKLGHVSFGLHWEMDSPVSRAKIARTESIRWGVTI